MRLTRATIRTMLAASLAVVSPVLVATPATAHGAGESTDPVELAQQAIAHLVHDPDNLMAAKEKVDDALRTADRGRVDAASLGQAKEALRRGDRHEARALLERAVGARPHLGSVEPLPIRQIPHAAVTGAESGTRVVTSPLPGRGALDGGSWAALAASVVVAASGAALAWRFRPRHARTSTAPTGERGA